MALRHYPLDRYDAAGHLLPPATFWLAILLLLHPFLLFLMAGVTQQGGGAILELFYPQSQQLWQEMLMALPALLAFWGVGARGSQLENNHWRLKARRFTKTLLLISNLAQLSGVLKTLIAIHGAFHWGLALMLLLQLWLLIYLLRSKSLLDYAAD